jgi:predicted nucleic acid-binding protein
MMVLVDTSIWSLALRRRLPDLSAKERAITDSLRELIYEGRVQMLGAVRQEILTGIRDQKKFLQIRSELRDYEDVPLDCDDYENAARMSNRCRESGIAATPIDMLLCAVSQGRDWQIFSADRDFIHYAKILAIRMMVA